MICTQKLIAALSIHNSQRLKKKSHQHMNEKLVMVQPDYGILHSNQKK